MSDSSCAPAHNTPLPLKRSPTASFKRLLDSALRNDAAQNARTSPSSALLRERPGARPAPQSPRSSSGLFVRPHAADRHFRAVAEDLGGVHSKEGETANAIGQFLDARKIKNKECDGIDHRQHSRRDRIAFLDDDASSRGEIGDPLYHSVTQCNQEQGISGAVRLRWGARDNSTKGLLERYGICTD